jgi:exodeoxyribonuclease VII large subunit
MNSEQKSLFDLEGAKGPSDKPPVGRFRDGGEMTVSSLIRQIKEAVTSRFDRAVTVVGELSNVSRSGSGHLYFSLKDERSSLDCVMWRSRAGAIKFEPEDGLEVVVSGNVDVYEVRGRLQVQVNRMTPRGRGALELAFSRLKEKLAAEGLFDPEQKKTIPRFPRAIGIITSPTGAAIRDMQQTLYRKWPVADVYLLPCAVQGEAAAEQLAHCVKLLDANAQKLGIDTMIIARGGGSLEDLWAFNEEVLARAVFRARTPVISGVGHEVDFTICDFTADLRAATPTAAAEEAVPDINEISRFIDSMGDDLNQMLEQRLVTSRLALEAVMRSAVFRDPGARIMTGMQHVDELAHRLRAASGAMISEARQLLESPARRLDASHPRHLLELSRAHFNALRRRLEAGGYKKVLARGFTVTRDGKSSLLASAAAAASCGKLVTEFSDGKIESVPEKVE